MKKEKTNASVGLEPARDINRSTRCDCHLTTLAMPLLQFPSYKHTLDTSLLQGSLHATDQQNCRFTPVTSDQAKVANIFVAVLGHI